MAAVTGKIWVLGDDIDTDIIIPTEYLALKTVDDMKKFAFSPLRPELAGQIRPGDIIVAAHVGGHRHEERSVIVQTHADLGGVDQRSLGPHLDGLIAQFQCHLHIFSASGDGVFLL